MKTLRPLLALLIAGAAAFAPAAEYEAGTHYIELPVAVETRDPEKLEVLEFFSYSCIHCYRLQPWVERWLRTQPDDVDFHRVHLVTRRYAPLAQVYFTAVALGVEDRVHTPMFQAIHEFDLNVSRPEYARKLFLDEAEVDGERFQEVYESFGINSRLRGADALGRAYKIMGTPTLVVNGRYVIDTETAGSQQGIFLVANYLLDKERAARP